MISESITGTQRRHELCSFTKRGEVFAGLFSGIGFRRVQESEVSGVAEVVMNCKSCNARIDYRFVSNCVECGGEIQQGSLPPSNLLQMSEPRLTWIQKLINAVYILVGSMAGLISGGVGAYYAFAITYRVFFHTPDQRSTSCGNWPDLIVIFSILASAYLCMVGGTVFTLKKPLCRVAQMGQPNLYV